MRSDFSLAFSFFKQTAASCSIRGTAVRFVLVWVAAVEYYGWSPLHTKGTWILEWRHTRVLFSPPVVHAREYRGEKPPCAVKRYWNWNSGNNRVRCSPDWSVYRCVERYCMTPRQMEDDNNLSVGHRNHLKLGIEPESWLQSHELGF